MFSWLSNDRLIIVLTIMFCGLGITSWLLMNNQEDPFFPYRNGTVEVSYPSADVEFIENSIVKVLERGLSDLDDIAVIHSTSQAFKAMIDIEINANVKDTDKAWQQVRNKLEDLQVRLPADTPDVILNDKIMDTEGIVIGFRSQKSLLQLRKIVLQVKDELHQFSEIRSIRMIGEPGSRFDVIFSEQLQQSLILSPNQIAQQIRSNNTYNANGVLRGDSVINAISSLSIIRDHEQLVKLKIATPDGVNFELGQISQIVATTDPYIEQSFWLNGKRSLGLAITLPPNNIRITDFSEKLIQRISKINARYPDIEIEAIFYQPKWTKKRLSGLTLSLLISLLCVAAILFLMINWRIAIVVSISIPIIALVTLAIYGSVFSGVLQQMSIAGMVLSLGLVVDNCIVIAELINRYRQSMPLNKACKLAVKELSFPLLTASLTTIAAFLPMILAIGDVADFIRTIPIIVILSVLTSLIVSLVLVPILCRYFMFTTKVEKPISPKLINIFEKILNRPVISLVVCLGIMIIGFISVINVNGEFFPKTSRNQAFIDLELNSGSSHNQTLTLVKEIENALKEKDKITKIVSFVGNSGPRFYYNMTQSPNRPNIARIVFETELAEQIPELVHSLNEKFIEQFSNIYVKAKELGQGPPVESPIEIFILGPDKAQLAKVAETVLSIVNEHPDTVDSRRGYVLAKTTLVLELNQDEMLKAGVGVDDLAHHMQWSSSGLYASDIYIDGYNVPIYIRNNFKTDTNSDDIQSIQIASNNQILPISLFAKQKVEGIEPRFIHRNLQNALLIKADLINGADDDDVLEQLQPKLSQLALEYDIKIDLGGEQAESREANVALLNAFPVGLILLIGCLVAQFRSIRLTFIILLTVPLAASGVFPALALSGVPFGFMSLLGFLGLVGIVVNNAIVLMDRMLINLKDGQSLDQSLVNAFRMRFRAVLLTSLTTIVGMLSLALSTSPLWPPLAWTMIGGLLFSTILTLIVIPCCAKLVCTDNFIKRFQG